MNYILQNTLGAFSCTDADSNIFVAHYTSCGCSHCSKHHKLMVDESGATLHMRTNIKDFDQTKYKRCKDVFVLMDDGRVQ